MSIKNAKIMGYNIPVEAKTLSFHDRVRISYVQNIRGNEGYIFSHDILGMVYGYHDKDYKMPQEMYNVRHSDGRTPLKHSLRFKFLHIPPEIQNEFELVEKYETLKDLGEDFCTQPLTKEKLRRSAMRAVSQLCLYNHVSLEEYIRELGQASINVSSYEIQKCINTINTCIRNKDTSFLSKLKMSIDNFFNDVTELELLCNKKKAIDSPEWDVLCLTEKFYNTVFVNFNVKHSVVGYDVPVKDLESEVSRKIPRFGQSVVKD